VRLGRDPQPVAAAGDARAEFADPHAVGGQAGTRSLEGSRHAARVGAVEEGRLDDDGHATRQAEHPVDRASRVDIGQVDDHRAALAVDGDLREAAHVIRRLRDALGGLRELGLGLRRPLDARGGCRA
jgi:hypothetical protein